MPRTTSRCPSCGHVDSDTVVVEIDGPTDSTPGGGGRRRGRDLLVIACILVALVVGLVVVSEDRGEDDAATAPSSTTSTERRRPRRTTTTRAATTTSLRTFGTDPLLREPTGVVLLLNGGSGGTTIIDLDAASEVDLPRGVTLNTNFVSSAVKGGFIGSRDGTPAIVFLDGRIVPITGSDFRVTADGERIFSVLYLEMLAHIREFDLNGAQVGQYALGVNGFFYATAHGVVTHSGGRVFLVTRAGPVTELAIGNPLGAGRELVVVWTCDEGFRCGPVIARPDGTTRPFPAPPDGDLWSECCSFAFSPDDRYLAMQTGSPGPEPEHPPRLVLIDTRSMRVARVIDVLFAGSLTWSQDSRWLFMSTQGPCFAHEVESGQHVELPFSCRDGVVATSR
jgi:hypothetical protein